MIVESFRRLSGWLADKGLELNREKSGVAQPYEEHLANVSQDSGIQQLGSRIVMVKMAGGTKCFLTFQMDDDRLAERTYREEIKQMLRGYRSKLQSLALVGDNVSFAHLSRAEQEHDETLRSPPW